MTSALFPPTGPFGEYLLAQGLASRSCLSVLSNIRRIFREVGTPDPDSGDLTVDPAAVGAWLAASKSTFSGGFAAQLAYAWSRYSEFLRVVYGVTMPAPPEPPPVEDLPECVFRGVELLRSFGAGSDYWQAARWTPELGAELERVREAAQAGPRGVLSLSREDGALVTVGEALRLLTPYSAPSGWRAGAPFLPDVPGGPTPMSPGRLRTLEALLRLGPTDRMMKIMALRQARQAAQGKVERRGRPRAVVPVTTAEVGASAGAGAGEQTGSGRQLSPQVLCALPPRARGSWTG
jgi:hypothetical protein